MNITANQFLLCYLHYLDQRDEDDKLIRKGEAMADLYRYASCNKGHIQWTKEEVRDLVDKGFLKDPHYKSKDTYPDDLEVTNDFIHKVFASKSRFQQLYDAYPTTIENFNHPSGPRIKLKACDYDKMEKLYNKIVKTKVLHKKIISLVEWARDNKLINTGFEKFIRGRLWTAYEEEKKHYDENNMNVQ